jgi:hypothetical protein
MESFQSENISVLQILANISEFFNLLRVNIITSEMVFNLPEKDFYIVLGEINNYVKQNLNDITDRFSIEIDNVNYVFIKV